MISAKNWYSDQHALPHGKNIKSHNYIVSRRSWNAKLLSRFFVLLIFLIAAHLHAAAFRKKTDVVYMRNGDRITCEIESLAQGQLNIKPEYALSTITIDWTKVDHLESSQLFIVTDPKGKLYTGTLATGIQSDTLTIVQAKSVTLPRDQVISINETGDTFFRRFSGNISVGSSFARSNSERNLSLQSSVNYESSKYVFNFSSNSQFSSQAKTTDTNETTVKTALFHELRTSNWYGGAIANYLSSSEQKIALQSTYGAALAKRVIYTNRTNLTGIAALGYTTQRNSSKSLGPSHTNSLDSAFSVRYSTFRFNSTTLTTNFWIYPSLTSWGHVRMSLNQDIYYKFVHDLFISMSLYDNYDTQPVAGAPTNNYGITTSIGWTFH